MAIEVFCDPWFSCPLSLSAGDIGLEPCLEPGGEIGPDPGREAGLEAGLEPVLPFSHSLCIGTSMDPALELSVENVLEPGQEVFSEP